ncbi:MAG TPA: C13 family peptidase [Steroidobacteraceae bacterium]|nr:C13 family peptidase [Steroidobacteraceae bacterium]
MIVHRATLNILRTVWVVGALSGALGAAVASSPLPEAERVILAEQPRRVLAEVDHMAPRVPGRPNVFFLGLAGYGEQAVFRKEEALARRTFGERFGSLDRSVELVNDVHDRESHPLATFENLRDALRLIGRRMDRDRDVLVLVVTSHGSAEDGIALTNGDLVDDALSPRDVRKVLDEAGIRWRVIVASACYAGIFIRPLRTDTTLIMTAADARHSSFGCADDRDLTYFGEALIHDALPGACSLEDAFASARRIIRRRESDEGEVHSNPQLYVGSHMRAKLAALDHVPTATCAGPQRAPSHHSRAAT